MNRPTSFTTTIVVAMLAAAPACGQGGQGGQGDRAGQNGRSRDIARGADVITETLVRNHVNVIAHDSMLGRATPSRGLELTAAYIADHFKRLGLKPGGDNGTYLQRYRIPERRTDGAKVADAPGRDASAPNAVGILEGTDPLLRNEYLVFSAHMDHVGVNAANPKDSIWNGADDDASGTAGLLALAEAFTRAPAKRSMIFLTVSGEEAGLWGSDWFTSHPPVPMGQMVVDLNLDMLGRNWKDTVVAIGKEHSDLGVTLQRVNAAHPELGMTAVDDLWPRESFYTRSDHFNFARRGVPVLFFFNGTHEDYHQPSDSPDKIDAEKESRIVRLIYFLGQEVGNAPARPKWNPESYRKIVQER